MYKCGQMRLLVNDMILQTKEHVYKCGEVSIAGFLILRSWVRIPPVAPAFLNIANFTRNLPGNYGAIFASSLISLLALPCPIQGASFNATASIEFVKSNSQLFPKWKALNESQMKAR